jgi:hypothetical protein
MANKGRRHPHVEGTFFSEEVEEKEESHRYIPIKGSIHQFSLNASL